jgi:S1-C subfamily serine protease
MLFRVDWSSRFQLLVVSAALLLLTWILAHWTWVFLTPKQSALGTVSQAPVLSKVLAEKVAAVHLFGGVGSAVTDATAAPVAAPSNIGVRGIYAGRGGLTGFAVLVLDGSPVAAVVGKEFAPGMVLRRVYPEYIEIERGGQIETVRMASAPMPGSGGGGGAASPGAAAGETPSLGINVRKLGEDRYGFSRVELLTMLKRPDQILLLGRYAPHPRGGAVLERSPVGGLPEKLGLKVGDVVSAINGKPLSGPGDVARLYDQLVKSESVSVDVLRAGEQMNIGIQVTP